MPPTRNRSMEPEDTDSSGEAINYKEKYLQALAIQGNVADQEKTGKKRVSTMRLGRGIPKVVSLFDDIRGVLEQAEYHELSIRDPVAYDEVRKDWDDEGMESLQADHKRAFASRSELFRLVPDLLQKINTESNESFNDYVRALERGASDARSDDILRLRAASAEWLNMGVPAPAPLLSASSRSNRGIQHDTCGHLLCPIEYDWSDVSIRESLRSCEPGFNFYGSCFIRCLYAGYTGDVKEFEDGFLKSALLLKVFMFIFMTPTAADHIDVHDNNALTLGLSAAIKKKLMKGNGNGFLPTNSVTPRAIAYAAVMLLFALCDAPSWNQGDFDYHSFYNFIIDYFEEPEEGSLAKARVKLLLKWWNGHVFPYTTARTQTLNTTSSLNKLRAQRSARERRDA